MEYIIWKWALYKGIKESQIFNQSIIYFFKTQAHYFLNVRSPYIKKCIKFISLRFLGYHIYRIKQIPFTIKENSSYYPFFQRECFYVFVN